MINFDHYIVPNDRIVRPQEYFERIEIPMIITLIFNQWWWFVIQKRERNGSLENSRNGLLGSSIFR